MAVTAKPETGLAQPGSCPHHVIEACSIHSLLLEHRQDRLLRRRGPHGVVLILVVLDEDGQKMFSGAAPCAA